MHNLVEGLLAGNRRSLAKLITLVESQMPEKDLVLEEIAAFTGNAYIVGITGPPGVGKSSLVEVLTKHIRAQGLTIGILAIDPSSPFSGGALLGDRVRMGEAAMDPGVFIRSMGTRGSLGGLATTTKEAIKVMDAFGMNVILVETVGVGQTELEIMNTADTTVVVLNPSSGDHIQAIKAGIMEIADIFVVNKSDLPTAQKTVGEVKGMLDLKFLSSKEEKQWRPPIIKTVTFNGQGIPELWLNIENHKLYLKESQLLAAGKLKKLQTEVWGLVEEQVITSLRGRLLKEDFQTIIASLTTSSSNPYEAARAILRYLGLEKFLRGDENI